MFRAPIIGYLKCSLVSTHNGGDHLACVHLMVTFTVKVLCNSNTTSLYGYHMHTLRSRICRKLCYHKIILLP